MRVKIRAGKPGKASCQCRYRQDRDDERVLLKRHGTEKQKEYAVFEGRPSKSAFGVIQGRSMTSCASL